MYRDIQKTAVWKACSNTAQQKDLPRGAAIMASAFREDPSIRYLLGGKTLGENDWRYFDTVLRAIYGKCILLSTDRSLNNLLILFPPQLKAVPTFRFFRKGGLRLWKSFDSGLYVRSVRYEQNCKA